MIHQVRDKGVGCRDHVWGLEVLKLMACLWLRKSNFTSFTHGKDVDRSGKSMV